MKKSFNKSVLQVFDHIEEGIHIIDKKGIIFYYNQYASKIDGIDRDRAINRHLLEVYPSLSHDSSTLLRVLASGQPIIREEQTFYNYKGEKITTINTSLPLKINNDLVGALEISKDITTVREMSEKIVDLQSKLYKTKSPTQEETAKYTFLDIIGFNKEILRLKKIALKAASTNAPVLIYGETGTGKELFVHSIHNASKRRDKPFITQNCAALPANLLESILFGTVKGSFTGAEDRQGLFELAHKGTLFLDEINSMPLDLQPKLLRVLQDGTIRSVGDVKTKKVDVRIITATNIASDLALENKLIRQDLFYRLNVINLNLPPLRERKDDIPILIDHFIGKYNKKLNKKVKGLSHQALESLMDYRFEGNVRELESIIESIMTIHDLETIGLDHLPRNFKKKKPQNLSLVDKIEGYEKTLIEQAFKENEKNISKTAETLKIPRQTLQYKIKKYKLNK